MQMQKAAVLREARKKERMDWYNQAQKQSFKENAVMFA